MALDNYPSNSGNWQKENISNNIRSISSIFATCTHGQIIGPCTQILGQNNQCNGAIIKVIFITEWELVLLEQPSGAGILYWTRILLVEIGNVRMAAIIGSTIVMPCLEVKSLQLPWRSDTCNFIYMCLIFKCVWETYHITVYQDGHPINCHKTTCRIIYTHSFITMIKSSIQWSFF